MIELLHVLLTIHHELDPNSGAPGTTMALAESLRKLGHHVEFLSFDDMPLHLPDRLAKLVFPFFVAFHLTIHARGGRFDVIDSSLGDTWAWAGLRRHFRRGSRRPLLVCRSHGLEHLYHEAKVAQAKTEGRRLSRRYRLYEGGWRLREIRRSMLAADLVVMLNERERDYAIEQLGVPEDRVRLIANGVPAWLLEQGRRTPEPHAGPAIAHVGQFRPMKGVAEGSTALVRVMLARPEVRASFIGTGVPREGVLEHFPDDLHDRIAVIEHYRREQLPELLREQAILLFPSLSEGFGKVVLESMACGLAPVASDISSMHWLVKDGETGLLVPPGDVDAIAAALLRLIDDRQLRERLQLGARAQAEQFSWDRIGREKLDLYREMLDRPAVAPA